MSFILRTQGQMGIVLVNNSSKKSYNVFRAWILIFIYSFTQLVDEFYGNERQEQHGTDVGGITAGQETIGLGRPPLGFYNKTLPVFSSKAIFQQLLESHYDD